MSEDRQASASAHGQAKVVFFLLASRSIASLQVRGCWQAEGLKKWGIPFTLQAGSGWLTYAGAGIAVLCHASLKSLFSYFKSLLA